MLHSTHRVLWLGERKNQIRFASVVRRTAEEQQISEVCIFNHFFGSGLLVFVMLLMKLSRFAGMLRFTVSFTLRPRIGFTCIYCLSLFRSKHLFSLVQGGRVNQKEAFLCSSQQTHLSKIWIGAHVCFTSCLHFCLICACKTHFYSFSWKLFKGGRKNVNVLGLFCLVCCCLFSFLLSEFWLFTVIPSK